MTKDKFLYQTKYGTEEKADEVGNCFITCVANVLGKRIEDCPNVETLYRVKKNGKDGYWLDVLMRWLDSIGYYYEQITEENPAKQDELYFAAGKTERGTMHEVIYKNGELYFDPYVNGNGLVEIEFYSVIRKY